MYFCALCVLHLYIDVADSMWAVKLARPVTFGWIVQVNCPPMAMGAC
jgi:hypothetical protein